MLKMMEQLAPASVWRAKRVRIEHGDGIQPDMIEKVVQFGLVVIQNPTHLALPMPGEPLASGHMLLKSFIAAGIPLALGSDGGPKEQNPFLNLMLATLHRASPEAVARSRADGLHRRRRLCEGQDQRKGRIAPGCLLQILQY